MLRNKIIHLKKIYKFCFDHFWVNRTALVLSVKNGFYKNKKSFFRPNYARYEKMVESKIIHLKKIYKFDLDHFLLKYTVFVLSIKNGFHKIKKSIFRPNYARYEKMLKNKIVDLKEIYKFDSYHFLVNPTVFVLSIMNGFYKIKKYIFRPNYSIYETMLTNKIVCLKKIPQFCIGHFLIG